MCGIFGVIMRPGGGRVRGHIPFEAMEVVRHRGSGLGGGFARSSAAPDDAPWNVRACIDRAPRDEELLHRLEDAGFVFDRPASVERIEGGAMPFWTGHAVEAPADPLAVCDAINDEYLVPGRLDARVVSCSRRVDVWKDVAHPASVATGHGLQDRHGDAWIAHTREPTNSPGRYPIWSHPFTMGDVAIVHNGDISSYGANKRFLRRQGYHSFTGTDSEVIAVLLHHLLTVEGLSPYDAADALVHGAPGLEGARLDGPFSVAATWSTADETFLLVMTDRQKLRPMILGQDARAFYCASEEAQIRKVSPDAEVWTPEPGGWFLASSTQGLLRSGRTGPRPGIHPAQVPREILATPAQGKRFVASGYHRGQAAVLQGPVGNAMAGGLQGGAVVVYGNVGDDACDSMLSGRVVVHGDARDVVGQAMQGGVVLVRGSVGNRAGLQMREYDDREASYRVEGDSPPAGLTPNHPALVVGGSADDHFGEYMAGGVALVLNLNEGPGGLTVDGAPETCVGKHVGTGMVGGRIYIRGQVDERRVGLTAEDDDISTYLDGLVELGRITVDVRQKVDTTRDPDRWAALMPDEPRALRLLANKYAPRPRIARRSLAPDDLALVGRALESFFEAFEVDAATRDHVLESAWTVISVPPPS